MKRHDSARARRAGPLLAAIFATLALAIAAGAYAAQALARHRFLLSKGDELRAIADLKVSQIVAWRAERLADARVAAGDPLLVAATREWLAAGGRAERGAALTARLSSLREGYGYERVSLLDAGGALRLTAPGPGLGRVETEELARQAVATGEVSFLDLHRSDTREGIHLELVAPLRLPGDPSARPVAFLDFLIDPQRFLYPLVQSWPTPSRSGETLLIRREGDAVVYLNELRHRKGTALVLRLPVGQSDLPSALAVQGKEGVVGGTDYRGQRAMAALRRVPDSPWFLVSKVDYQEVVAPLARDAWLIGLLALALIAVAGLVAQRVWRGERDVSDAGLHESEERYRSLFQCMLNGFAYCRMLFDQGCPQDFVYLEVNPAFEMLTGLRDVVGKRATEVIPGIREADPELFEIYGRVARTGNPETFEAYVAALKMWFWITAYSPKPEHFVAVFDVITERKRAEEGLRESESRYRSLAEAAQDDIFIVDPEHRLRYVNACAAGKLRQTPAEVVGQRIEELFPPEVATRFSANLAEAFATGRPVASEQQASFPGGQVWLSTSLVPLPGPRGEIGAVMGISRDITERKKAEEILRASEQRYRTLFDRNLAGVYRSTRDGRLLECNDAFARIFGYASREDILSAGANALYPTQAARQAFLESLEERGAVFNHEFEGRCKEGRAVWLLENAHLAAGDEPGAPGIIEGTLLDITERRRLEHQLRQAQKLEAIGQLAGGVAHDFNNLLGVIGGHTELALKRLGAEDPLRRHLDEIRKAGDRAAALTRQLLAFSRRQIVEPTVLDLDEVVRGLEEMLGRLIPEDIQLVTALSAEAALVSADRGQVEQVVMNLAVNARDAMPEGGRLAIETARAELDAAYCREHAGARPGPHVMLAVSDTGIGMDAETRAHVFEPFFTTKEPGKGTGLGLATVYGIVKQAGGSIWVYSEPGQGTTFKVYLPEAEEGEAAARPAGAPGEVPRGTETILLVEDEEALRTLTREVLESLGYTVLEARHGVEALELSRGHEGRIDLLLTDVVMPHMSGRELAERLLASRPQTRTLFISGYTDDAVMRHGLVGSQLAFLQKPFTADALARKVREMLDAPRAS